MSVETLRIRGPSPVSGLSPVLLFLSFACIAAPAARIENGVVLLPGETLVAPAGPVSAPRPAVEPRPAPKPAPRAPQYSNEEIRNDSYARSTRSICVNCAVVTAVERGDRHWEIRLRFDDGTRETVRTYESPSVRAGDAVHVEDGRLVRD